MFETTGYLWQLQSLINRGNLKPSRETLRNHDNRKLKQRRRRRQRERQKSNRFKLAKQQLCTCITLFCTFLCRRCATTTWNFLVSRFVEDVNTRQWFSFSELRYSPLESTPEEFPNLKQIIWNGARVINLKRRKFTFQVTFSPPLPSWLLKLMTATRTSENIVLKKDKAMLFCNNFFTQTTNTYHNFPNRSFADNSHQIDLFICCSVKLEKLSVPTRKESSPPIYKLHASRSFQNALGLGQTSNFFMRRTKLSKLSSWKARRLTQLSSSELVWIVQNVLSVCFRGITSEYRLRDKCGSSHATN